MNILSEFGAWLLGIGGDTLTFIKGLVTVLASNPQIQSIATQEVQNVETAAEAGLSAGNVMTGVQKFAQAQGAIVAQLTTAELPVILNQVNLAIEGAVANLRTSNPVASS